MDKFAKEESKTRSPFMAYKVYLEDLTNIVEICNNKCINNYNDFNLNPVEKLCLEKCFVKTLEMNQYVADEFPNIMSKQSH